MCHKKGVVFIYVYVYYRRITSDTSFLQMGAVYGRYVLQMVLADAKKVSKTAQDD